MFDVADRDHLRARLESAARADPEIDAAALIGSAARGDEDRWSDIDLAVRVTPGADPTAVADRWTDGLQRDEDVVDHLDIQASGALYRVFLLGSTLQVDLSFWPSGGLVTSGAAVRLLFGRPDDSVASAAEDAAEHLRMGWLYALHVRSALARGRSWQAVWMLEQLRNRIISLCCLRHGLPTQEGRGVDRLPAATRSGLVETLPAGTDLAHLRRTFGLTVSFLLSEAERSGVPVTGGLRGALDELVDSSDGR